MGTMNDEEDALIHAIVVKMIMRLRHHSTKRKGMEK